MCANQKHSVTGAVPPDKAERLRLSSMALVLAIPLAWLLVMGLLFVGER